MMSFICKSTHMFKNVRERMSQYMRCYDGMELEWYKKDGDKFILVNLERQKTLEDEYLEYLRRKTISESINKGATISELPNEMED